MSYYVVKSPARDYIAGTLEAAEHVQQMLELIGVASSILLTDAELNSELSA